VSDAQLGREFRKAFARRPIEAMADGRSFDRGLLYAANGRVGKRTVTESTVKAKVRGSSSYQVKLWVKRRSTARARSGWRAGSVSTRSRWPWW